jgi:hypothetical protein
MRDWNDREITTAVSSGGVVLVADFGDNLLRDDQVPWPPPAIVQKLYESRHGSRFADDVATVVAPRLGFYSDLQSIHSEDAITWSYFGLLAPEPPAARAQFLNWLLRRLNLGELAHNSAASIDLWRRVAHPDRSTTRGGPELDVVVDGDVAVVYVEAKWRSPEGVGQGVDKTQSQLQLRCRFLAKHGRLIYGDREFVVVGVVLDEPMDEVDPSDRGEVHVASIRWSELAEYDGHPRADEFRRYYEWKLRHSLPLRPRSTERRIASSQPRR